MLPPHNMPDVTKQGVRKLHATDAKENIGLFIPHEPKHNLTIVDYSDVKGYEGESLGWGVRTEVALKKGNMISLLVYGVLGTEEKFVEAAKAKGESPEFSRNPGAFAFASI